MPAGKYTFYLHSDDRTDMLAAATIETVSQPLRGDFLRTVVAAGSALYQIDARLPGLLTELFDGQLRAGQLTGLAAVVSGHYTLAKSVPDEAPEKVVSVGAGRDDRADRRRFTLVLPEEDATRRAIAQLESVSARLRGPLLRSLLVSGCALHTLDPRFPRLLASLPVLPDSALALVNLARQLTGEADVPVPQAAVTAAPEPGPALPAPESSAQHEVQPIVRNMKKLF